MPVTYLKCECPHCGQVVEYPMHGVGQIIGCPNCSKPLKLPKQSPLDGCPSCGQPISRQAAACPHCGHALRSPMGLMVGAVILGILVAFLILAFAGCLISRNQ